MVAVRPPNMKPWLDSLIIILWLTVPCLFSATLLAQDAGSPTTALLTNASQVLNLKQEDAARHLPVRLRGVVIGEAEAGGEGLAIQDDTAGIYLRTSPSEVAKRRPGDFVEVEGVTDPGEFAPFVQVKQLRSLGTNQVPQPRVVTFEELTGGDLDSQWVEISGIVRYCEPEPRKWRLELATGGGRLVARLNMPKLDQPLVDAEVRLRGVCYYLVNKQRQSLSPLISVPRGVPVEVKVPALANPFDAPVRSAGNLMQFRPDGSYKHRVHVRGVVTCYEAGQSLWIRDGGLGLRIETRQKENLKPGDEVDMVGFPQHGGYSPVLEDSVFQKRSDGPPPVPLRLAKAEEAFDHDADLVELEAVVTQRQDLMNNWIFSLESETGIRFKALLRQRPGQTAPAGSRPGSRVNIVGICSVIRDYTGPSSGLHRPQSFQLLLRSLGDLTLIKPPPWWTRQRVTWLLAAVAVVLLIGIATVMTLARQRLREQAAHRAMAEAEFSAILAERNRMAREIHDTLAQGLVATSVQLELAKNDLKSAPEAVPRHLERAHELVRASLQEARNSIWNMRSQVLETHDLGSALNEILKQLSEGTGVEARMRVTGNARRLPPVTENNLLRVGQEAITNATRHAQARHIEVTLDYAEKQVRLTVKDDGKGFDAAKPPPAEGGFGLVGMRERAAHLRGELKIESAPALGTMISLVVPVSG